MNTIKISSLAFLFTILCLNHTQAQTKGTSQINIGYGVYSHYEFAESFFNDVESSGVLNMGIKYAIQDRFMLGGSLSYESMTGTEDFIFLEGEPGSADFTNITIAVESDYRYISKDSFQMYSGLGLAYFTADQYTTNFSFQISALGFRVGKNLAAYAELGFGYKGIVHFGASYQF